MKPMSSSTKQRFPRAASLRVRDVRAMDQRLASLQQYQRADYAERRRLVQRMQLSFQLSAPLASFFGGVLLTLGFALALTQLVGLVQGDVASSWTGLVGGLGGLLAGVLMFYSSVNSMLHLSLYGAVLGELDVAEAQDRAPRPLLETVAPEALDAPLTRVALRLPDLTAKPHDVQRIEQHFDTVTTLRGLDAAGRRARLLRQAPAMRIGALGLAFALGLLAALITRGDNTAAWLLGLKALAVVAACVVVYLGLSSWRFASLLEVALFEANAADREGRAPRKLVELGHTPTHREALAN